LPGKEGDTLKQNLAPGKYGLFPKALETGEERRYRQKGG
jgi:hypothetical protein